MSRFPQRGQPPERKTTSEPRVRWSAVPDHLRHLDLGPASVRPGPQRDRLRGERGCGHTRVPRRLPGTPFNHRERGHGRRAVHPAQAGVPCRTAVSAACPVPAIVAGRAARSAPGRRGFAPAGARLRGGAARSRASRPLPARRGSCGRGPRRAGSRRRSLHRRALRGIAIAKTAAGSASADAPSLALSARRPESTSLAGERCSSSAASCPRISAIISAASYTASATSAAWSTASVIAASSSVVCGAESPPPGGVVASALRTPGAGSPMRSPSIATSPSRSASAAAAAPR
jgi:hypothetical protein